MMRNKEELLELVRKHGTKVMNDDELTYYIFEDPDPEINCIIDKEFEKIDAMLERITWKDKFRLWLRFLFHGRRLEKMNKIKTTESGCRIASLAKTCLK